MWEQFFLFLGQAFVILVVFLLCVLGVVVLVMRAKSMNNNLEVDLVNEKIHNYTWHIKSYVGDPKEFKKEYKAEVKKLKDQNFEKKLFVLNFDGDLGASEVENLREEITALLTVATPQDEVLVKIESEGGMVHSYGLGASQLERIKTRGIPLTTAVDRVAASGGYMMACVGDKLIAAPFAIVGSIGVIAEVPNFAKVLKKYDVDYREYTAGEHKRTVTMFGEISPEKENKFKEQLEQTHVLFKAFVHRFRTKVQIDQVATGEYWYGETALGLGLVDSLETSDDYVLKATEDHEVVSLKYKEKKPLAERVAETLGRAAAGGVSKILQKLIYSARV